MKRIAIILGGLLALLLAAALAATLLIDPNHFRPMLQQELTRVLGREVKLGDLKLSVFSGSVTANDLSIADDAAYSRTPFVQAKSLAIGVELWPLLTSRQLHVTGLTIEQPAISLIQTPDGEWNFSKLGGDKAAKSAAPAAPGAPMDLSVKLVKIAGGRFSVLRVGGHARPLVLEDVNLEVHDFAAGSAFPFHFAAKVGGGGAIELEGKAGPLDSADVAASPVTASLKVDKLDLAGSGVTQSARAIAGLIAFQSTLESDGKIAQIKGKLKAENLKLAIQGTPAKRPVEFDFSLEENLRKRSGELRQGEIKIGSAVAALAGSFAAQGESTVIHMNLNGPKMSVTELEALLPALGVVLPNGSRLEGGTASVKLEMEGAVERLVTSGTVSLDGTKLAGFDMGTKMKVIESLAGIHGGPDTEIQTLGAKVRVAPEGTTAENLQLIVPSIGNLDGNGTVSPTKALDFKMRATVRNIAIPFSVTGQATDPVFRPDMKSLARQEVGKLTGGDPVKAATGLLKGLLGGKKDDAKKE
jgi:AsmA protein